jgi:hypothetical protein
MESSSHIFCTKLLRKVRQLVRRPSVNIIS